MSHTASDAKPARRASAVSWRPRVNAILRHLKGGPACSPNDLRCLHIVLREPVRPLPSPAFERAWDIFVDSEYGRSLISSNETSLQSRYGPKPEILRDWCGGTLYRVNPFIKHFASILWGKAGKDYKGKGNTTIKLETLGMPTKRRGKDSRKPKTRSRSDYKLNCPSLEFRHGKDLLHRTIAITVSNLPPPTNVTPEELFSLAAMAAECYRSQPSQDVFTVRVLSISNTFTARILKTTVSAAYLESLLANPSSPYADLAGEVEIEQSPSVDVLELDNMKEIMGGLFGDVEPPATPALPMPGQTSSPESVLRDRTNIPASSPCGGVRRKRQTSV